MALALGLALSPMVGASTVAPMLGASTVAPAVGPIGGPAAPRPAAPPPIEPDRGLPAAPLPEPVGVTTRVSERPGGGDAAGPSADASISADGRYVAFSSTAPDLVAGDTNGSPDVFLRDRISGVTIRLPFNARLPVPPGARASDPSISPDGGFVAFTYLPGAGPAGTLSTIPNQPIVVMWDAASDSTRIVSIDGKGGPAFSSSEPSISAGGRFVAYTSFNPNITTGDKNGLTDVFRVDTSTGATTMISQTPSGTSPKGSSRSPSISADGSVVAFTSNALNILRPDPPPTPTPTPSPSPSDGGIDSVNGPPAPGLATRVGAGSAGSAGSGEDILPTGASEPEPTASEQVYARNVPAASTELISITLAGEPGLRPSVAPSISADGGVIAFVSFDPTLAAGDDDTLGDVLVRERSLARTSLLTADLPAAGDVAISGNGGFVVFESATGPGGNGVEVFHRDRFDGTTIHVSVALTGGDGGPDSFKPVVSANGSTVSWTSTSSRLITGDGNGVSDVFVREFPPAGVIDPGVLDFGTRALRTSAPSALATLTSVGWSALGNIVATIDGGDAGDFALVADSCTGVLLPRPQSCTMTVQFTPQKAGPRSSTLRVTDNGVGSPHSVRLLGAGSSAELTLDPPSGPPGIVTIAVGKDFPPNTAVVLKWTVGISQPQRPIVTDAAGAFRIQVLVFHHDIEGPRDLVASPADGTTFEPIAVDFFVSTTTNSPPGFDPLGLTSHVPRGWFQR